MKKVLFAGLLCAVDGAMAVLTPGLLAAAITVTNANDGGPGSLRDAIALASRGDEIQFDGALARVPIVLTTGELVIDKDLAITGLGRNQTIVDGNETSRVFNVSSPAVVTISMLTVRNGLQQPTIAPWPFGMGVIEEGGGIYNSGTLRLRDLTVRGNKISGKTCDSEAHCYYGAPAYSIKGGGIFNAGTLTLDRCVIEENQADAYDAYGGGIYNSGEVMMIGTTISGNSGASDRAHGLQGIGILNDASATMVILDGSIAGNSQGASQAIHNLGTLSLTRTTIAGNGWWRGGGLNNQGIATVVESTVISNWTGAGGQQGGFAGGITNRGFLALVRSTVSGNVGEGDGGMANGFAGTLRIINSTISDNEGYWGAGGLGFAYASPAAVTVAMNSTISGNIRGGVRFPSAGMFVLKNSIIAGNYADWGLAPDDCEGSIASLGHNFLGETERCQGLSDGFSGDRAGIDWREILENRNDFGALRPRLADNGGPTYTVALLPDSPAVDHIPAAACTDDLGHAISTDQRGVTRPQGSGCDAGAFELSLPRGAGFWAHQCSADGFQQVDASELQDLFAKIAESSSAFTECAAIGCDALMPQLPQNDLRARAVQALLDVWLNLETGRLTRGRPLDLPGLTSATSVGEVLGEIDLTVCDPDATRADLGNAKDTAEAITGGTDDMELAALEYSATVAPGATTTVALGLINMSPDNRNYEISVSGPWPVQLSASRINALKSGDTAQFTATFQAPQDAQGTTARIRITATDLLSHLPLSREVNLLFQVAGSAPVQPVMKKR